MCGKQGHKLLPMHKNSANGWCAKLQCCFYSRDHALIYWL